MFIASFRHEKSAHLGAIRSLFGLLATAGVLSVAAAQTAPTAGTLSAAEIDRQWVQATAPYAKARAAQLEEVRRVTAAGPLAPDWQSLQAYRVPDWYRDAKFGIFLHWGVFSVPAFGSEWYSRNLYQQGSADFAHHVATYGPQTEFGYKDLIPKFRMERFDPDAWARLAKESGARYVVPVAEHHDGFALYDSHLTEWNAKQMGPKRDIFGDLAKAVRAQGLYLGASSHRAEHDWFFDGGRSFASDVNDPKFASFYGPAHPRILQSTDDAALSKDFTPVSDAFREDWLARTAEIVERYHPDLLYFDWWVGHPAFRETELKFAAFYYDYAAQHHQPVVMNYKYDNMREGTGVLDVERGQLPGIRALPWQTDTSLSNASWGYIDGDTYKKPGVLIDELADVVSKNGNLLLNVGPRADGTIPEPAQAILREIGGWLTMNGEAIYGSRPWRTFGEGPTEIASGTFQDRDQKPFTAEDFRFTTKRGAADEVTFYAIELEAPAAKEVVIRSFASGAAPAIGRVELLGVEGELGFRQAEDGLHVTLPAAAPGKYAWVFRLRGRR